MISVGSGSCVFLEPNQLQADKQASITSTTTLKSLLPTFVAKISGYHAGPPAASSRGIWKRSRTHDHSSMAVASDDEVSTHFDVPVSQESGLSKLEVVANGIASEPLVVVVK
jgi:hypothetical protein